MSWCADSAANILRVFTNGFFLFTIGVYGCEMLLANVSCGSLVIIMACYLMLFELPIAWISIESSSIFSDKYGICSMIRYE